MRPLPRHLFHFATNINLRTPICEARLGGGPLLLAARAPSKAPKSPKPKARPPVSAAPVSAAPAVESAAKAATAEAAGVENASVAAPATAPAAAGGAEAEQMLREWDHLGNRIREAVPASWDEEAEGVEIPAPAPHVRRARWRRWAWGIGLGVLGWAALNAPVRSLGRADDTLGHALGRAWSQRSGEPLRNFGSRLSGGLATSWASIWGASAVLSADGLKGAAGTLECDVLVTGATPSGVAAALAAARRGARVIVVEKRSHAGGDVVYAMLNMFDVMAKPGETARVHGLFAEFFEQLGVSCDIDRARELFTRALKAEPNVRFIPNVSVVSVYKDGDRVAGVKIQQGKAIRPIACKVLIDATNDADVAAMAGAGFFVGRESANPDKRMQSAGLLFSVKNVDWAKVRAYVSSRRLIRPSERKNRRHAIDIAPVRPEPTSKPGKTRAVKLPSPAIKGLLPAASRAALAAKAPKTAKPGDKTDAKAAPKAPDKIWLRLGGGIGSYAWERGDIVKGYQARGRDIVMLSVNFGRQSDGSVVLNTLNIVNVDGLDASSRRSAREQGVREIPFFLRHLRARMPGFEKATLGRVAPELYIRETRHIHGFYALKVEDIRAQTKFFDRVTHAAYPLDLHPYTKTDVNPFGPQRFFYTVPLRSLIPRGVDNVLVASRALSATYAAAGSARVIPVTMGAGEAAGVAAWECARNNRTTHQLTADYPLQRVVQDSLRKGGADIGD
jgi:hypothetical protein